MALESTIYIFLTAATFFYLVAAIGKNRLFLWPAAGIMILLGSMIIVTGGIKVNAGDTTTFTGNSTGTVSSSPFSDRENITTTSVSNKTVDFREIDDNYDKFVPSTLLGIILIVAGLMSMILASDVRGNLIGMFS